LSPDRKLETGAAWTGQAGAARDPKKPEPSTTAQGEPDGDRDAMLLLGGDAAHVGSSFYPFRETPTAGPSVRDYLPGGPDAGCLK